jgi:hypothetical protein
MRIVIIVLTCWLGLLSNLYAQCDGARISLTTGDTVAFVCGQDGIADFISFQTTSSDTGYSYIFTDVNNIIITEIIDDSIDIDPLGGFQLRIWGLAYDGTKTITPGFNINALPLSTGCSDLSDNFIPIIGSDVDGGFVANNRGFTRLTFCVGDGLVDPVLLANSSSSTSNYAYALADDQGRYIRTISGSLIDFENEMAGVYTIWRISYSGSLSLQPGDSLPSANLSSRCFELSNNNMIITLNSADAGRVYTIDGDSVANVCKDGSADLFRFINTGTSNTNYTYIVTNASDEIMVVLTGDSVDFDGYGIGTFRVYGVAHLGVLNAQPMRPISSLNTNCLGISENFFEVHIDAPPAAERVSFDNGDTTATICVRDGSPDLLTIITTATDTPYAFVLTNTNDDVFAVFANSPATIDFDGTSPDTCRVYGVAYTGSLDVVPGRNLSAGIATGCTSLSENFLTINKVSPDGGRAFALPGTFSVNTCIGNGPVWVRFSTTSASSLQYSYVITSSANLVLGYGMGDSLDMNQYPVGRYQVWGISHWGNLRPVIGQGIDTAVFSDSCFALSSNPISITNGSADGGLVSGPLGSDTVNICSMDGSPDMFRASVAQTDTANFDTWVITDKDNVVRRIFFSSSASSLPVDFDTLSNLPVRVWNLNYSGSLLLSVGDTVGSAPFATGCSDLSDNFILVQDVSPDGGRIAASPGGFSVDVCLSGSNTTINFVNSTFSAELPYNYVVTDNRGVILTRLSGAGINFSLLYSLYTVDTFQIYGVSFLQGFRAIPGQNIDTAQLASGCFDRSSNFVEVRITNVDGGRVFANSGEFSLEYCLDGKPDVAVFNNTSNSQVRYAYCITDSTGLILSILPASSFDFEQLSLGLYRVYGISYVDSLPVQPGQSVTNITSQACYSLSSNFVEVTIVNSCIGEICLMEDYQPGDRRAWSVWLKGLWGSPGYAYSFFHNSGLLIINPDSTARIVGRIYNKIDPRYQWDIDVSLHRRLDWNAWSALGRSYASPGKRFADSNHPFWDYWELDPNGNNTFTGVPGTSFAGKQLRISHRPANLYKGFQRGQGANDKNAMHGFSGWFYFSGDYDGIGDFNNFIRCDDSEWYQQLVDNYLRRLEENGFDDGGRYSEGGRERRTGVAQDVENQQLKPLSTTFRNHLLIECPEEGQYAISLFDLQGRKLLNLNSQLQRGKNRIDLSALSQGTYVINIAGSNGSVASARLLKIE